MSRCLEDTMEREGWEARLLILRRSRRIAPVLDSENMRAKDA